MEYCRTIFLTIALVLAVATPRLSAQNDPGKGWVEGVLITDKGKPAWGSEYGNTARITVKPKEGNGVYTDNDPSKGGFFTLRNLRPGIYEIFVNNTFQRDGNDLIKYRPQHIFGLVVEADKRTILNITVHEGEALEEVGQPEVSSQKAILLVDQLARLRKELDELKRVIDDLRKR